MRRLIWEMVLQLRWDKIKTQATQSKTATGYYAIKAAGIKLYDIRVSNNTLTNMGKLFSNGKIHLVLQLLGLLVG